MKIDEIANQPPPLAGTNAWRGDPLLAQITEDFPQPLRRELDAVGRFALSAEAQDLARLANTEAPRLRTHDRQGRRMDIVEFHPAYHALMRRSVATGLHCSIWENVEGEEGRRHQARAARFYLTAQLECGHLCPITMTNASLAAIMASPKVFREWAPRIASRKYDPVHRPATEKQGVTLGMGMTEKQGGTDVRANISRAEHVGDGYYRLEGHKWFMSAPMCDAFLVLAQGEGGLTCYLMPRYRPDGGQNAIRFQRLKDKLGNKSNASSEVEFHAAYAERVGAEGAGVRTIIEMVNLTRMDCAFASAGQMRIALSQAIHHIRHRSVFQRRLSDQPAMRAVVADLALELEAQVALVMRLAHAADRKDSAYTRLLTPAVKFLVCKSAPAVIYEALECLGGNGYTEDLPMARYFRESPLNAIWEGSGNVMALDVLRAAGRQPDEAMATVSALAKTASAACDVRPLVDTLGRLLRSSEAERRARFLCEGLARIAALAALVEAKSEFAQLYGDTRLSGAKFAQFGTTDLGAAEVALMDRALAT